MTGRWARQVLLAGVLCTAYAAASRADDVSVACQSAGWDMTPELKAYAGDSSRVAAGGATWNTPVLWADTLYAVALRPQSDVHFVQESPNAPRAAASMAGLARFTVLTGGRYRVTVDTALWIDAVDATGIVAPSGYITWHECPLFRKSVDYQLQAGQTVVLQFSGATASLAKVTVELVPR